jgi:hypothetical protein
MPTPENGQMTQLDQILLDDSERGELSPEQFMARWKPLLESLDRMFEDPQQQVADNEDATQGPKP